MQDSRIPIQTVEFIQNFLLYFADHDTTYVFTGTKPPVQVPIHGNAAVSLFLNLCFCFFDFVLLLFLLKHESLGLCIWCIACDRYFPFASWRTRVLWDSAFDIYECFDVLTHCTFSASLRNSVFLLLFPFFFGTGFFLGEERLYYFHKSF